MVSYFKRKEIAIRRMKEQIEADMGITVTQLILNIEDATQIGALFVRKRLDMWIETGYIKIDRMGYITLVKEKQNVLHKTEELPN